MKIERTDLVRRVYDVPETDDFDAALEAVDGLEPAWTETVRAGEYVAFEGEIPAEKRRLTPEERQYAFEGVLQDAQENGDYLDSIVQDFVNTWTLADFCGKFPATEYPEIYLWRCSNCFFTANDMWCECDKCGGETEEQGLRLTEPA